MNTHQSNVFFENSHNFMKTKMLQYAFYALTLCAGTNAVAKTYEVPPSSTTSVNVPYISDAAMEQCVKLYNEAKWLGEEMGWVHVNQYSQASVDAYNSKVSRYSEMIDFFNRNCAGKQSESAYKSARKLNQQQTTGQLTR